MFWGFEQHGILFSQHERNQHIALMVTKTWGPYFRHAKGLEYLMLYLGIYIYCNIMVRCLYLDLLEDLGNTQPF